MSSLQGYSDWVFDKALVDAITSAEKIFCGTTLTASADTITIDDVLEAKSLLDEMNVPSIPMPSPDMEIGGVRVFASPYAPSREPRQRLASSVDVSSAFREDMDAWLEDFFGTMAVAYVFQGNMMMHPGNLCDLKNDPSIRTYMKYEV